MLRLVRLFRFSVRFRVTSLPLLPPAPTRSPTCFMRCRVRARMPCLGADRVRCCDGVRARGSPLLL
eukprot:1716903-Rhodomonas_salina.1